MPTQNTNPAPTIYYPSLVVNLRLRFDEALSINTNQPAPDSVEDLAGAPTATNPQVKSSQPLLLSGKADQLSQIVGIVPKTCAVELPAYRQAGKFNITMEFRDLPLDPRVIRSMGVEIHLGAVPAGDFGSGMVAGFPNTVGLTPPPRRTSVINTRDSAGNLNYETLLMVGIVDDHTVEHTEDGSTVYLEGRDLRGLLLDTFISPLLLSKLQLNYGIDIVVEQILSFNPLLAQGIIVDVDPTEWPGGTIPSPGVLGNLTRVQQGASGGVPVMQTQGDPQKLNFWDIITQYCFLVGAVPHFVGEHLRIRPGRSLFDQKLNEVAFNPNVPTPFAGGAQRNVSFGVGVSTASTPISYRRLTYGRDIKAFKFERKLAGTKVPTVEVVCVDTGSSQRGSQRLLKARWPDLADGAINSKVTSSKVTSVGPSGQVTQEDILRIPVHGIKDISQLRRIARDLREEIGRGEMGGSCSTRNLASLGGDNGDPDLVRLRVGDAVEFLVDAANLGVRPSVISELTTQNARSFEEQVAALTKRLGDPNLARVLVATSRGSVQELQRTFRVGNIKYAWDAKNGIDISFDYQNYVEIRYDVVNGGPGVAGGTTPPSKATQQSNAGGTRTAA